MSRPARVLPIRWKRPRLPLRLPRMRYHVSRNGQKRSMQGAHMKHKHNIDANAVSNALFLGLAILVAVVSRFL